MIGLDTNILVRYLVQDDIQQANKANHLIENAVTNEEVFWINHIVICELIWVLSKAYDYPKAVLLLVLEKLLLTKQFEIQDKNAVWDAINRYQNSQADFADCLIGSINHAADCSVTLTFDKSAAKLSTFKSL
jgi:predicted nucleic-acid-binding protein